MSRGEVTVRDDQPPGPGQVRESGPILAATKLQPPALRQRVVARDRLSARLDTRSPCKVTLVDAPAGWGKTTLLAGWAAERDRGQTAWVSLDSGDNDPVVFWSYVIGALRGGGVRPGIGRSSLSLLHSPGASLLRQILPELINDLAALPERIDLVLDDYHLIVNRDIHEGMAFLVQYLPATVHVVIASRTPPSLPIAQLRLRGELTEIRDADLRFSAEETAGLLNGVLDLGLDESTVQHLQQETEGWVGGLCLAALSIGGRANAHEFVEQFAGRDSQVVDYLTAEVLSALSERTRTFVLRTSILDSLCGPLCDAVLEGSGSARTLDEIERANIFVVALDSTRRWYRYHRLFGELLRYELERTQPELPPELHRRAADWYRQTGSISEAITHSIAAGDISEAAEMVSTHWGGFLQHGRLGTVAGWLDAMPAADVASIPGLCLTRAWLAVNLGQLDELDRWIDAAQRATGKLPEGDGRVSLEAAVAMLRCVHRYMSGDVADAIAAAKWAVAREPDESSPWRSVGCPVLGLSLFWRGEDSEGASTLEEALPRSRSAANHLAVVHALGGLAAICAEQGALEQAEELAGRSVELSRDRGLTEHWAMSLAHVVQGKAHMSRGELEVAQALVARGLELSQRGLARVEAVYALLTLAQVRLAQGDRSSSYSLVRLARQRIAECPDPGILTRLLQRTDQLLDSSVAGGLTGRELAVLRAVADGGTDAEVAKRLSLSERTVHAHLRSVYGKLDVKSRTSAVRLAQERRLLI